MAQIRKKNLADLFEKLDTVHNPEGFLSSMYRDYQVEDFSNSQIFDIHKLILDRNLTQSALEFVEKFSMIHSNIKKDLYEMVKTSGNEELIAEFKSTCPELRTNSEKRKEAYYEKDNALIRKKISRFIGKDKSELVDTLANRHSNDEPSFLFEDGVIPTQKIINSTSKAPLFMHRLGRLIDRFNTMEAIKELHKAGKLEEIQPR
ncbi:MAG: hypothetical protein FWE31_03455 [Firmicutes bacterium]|nr:hypothetical protein [Bacillota bacterium]